MDIAGNPKGAVKGNIHCWLGNLEYVTKDAEPGRKLLTYYSKRQKTFGKQCLADRGPRLTREVGPCQNAFQHFCELAGVQRAKSINNMWAKKSFAEATLGALQLPLEQVMAITGHRSELALREFYNST